MSQICRTSKPRRGLRSAAVYLFTASTLVVGLAGAEDSKKAYTEAELAALPVPGPNPFLSIPTADANVDWKYWRAKMAFEDRARAGSRQAERALGLETFKNLAGGASEVEPNNSLGEAQFLPEFGTEDGDSAALTLSGSIAAPVAPMPFSMADEDNGSIPLATPTGLVSGQSVTAMGMIGDGPHGTGGSFSGDFDFFLISGVKARQVLSMEVKTPSSAFDLDPNCALWDSAGHLIEFLEDFSIGDNGAAFDFDCRLVFEAPADGDYYFSIGGWAEDLEQLSELLPADPFDSASGSGFASEGAYTVTLGLDAIDRDCYSLDLIPGDTLGTHSAGGDNLVVRVSDPSGRLKIGAITDRTRFYPAASPLVGGGAVTNSVATEAGKHTVCVDGDPGAYTIGLQGFRPVFDKTESQQIFFVDFDGAPPPIFDHSPDMGPLSPLSDFLTGWDLAAEDEDALIDVILATLKENLIDDLLNLSNPSFSVLMLNSRDHEDPFGQPFVSRIIIGGTQEEAGLSWVSVAESVDPGNLDTEETALVLLDALSAPDLPTNRDTLNSIEIADGAKKIDLVGLALGNLASHEAGHLLGLWHTESLFSRSEPSLMDSTFDVTRRVSSIGLGPDQIFGTADDIDVDFSSDQFSLRERYLGFQDTGEIAAHILTGGGSIFRDGFESGNTEAWASSSP